MSGQQAYRSCISGELSLSNCERCNEHKRTLSHSDNQGNMFYIKGLRISTGRRQTRVSYLPAWSRIRTREYREQVQLAVRMGLGRRASNRSASLPPAMKSLCCVLNLFLVYNRPLAHAPLLEKKPAVHRQKFLG